MSDIEIWAVIILLTIATVVDRSAFWVVGHHINLPRRVQEALRYAPSCALAAIVAPDFFINDNQLVTSLHNPKLIAGVVASAFYLWKKDMLLTIVFGMGIFSLVRLYF
ncbi:AzlD domain-containing protein [Undibacterium fentianense]|uniref:AzlD domain-containing protein n=1 Tax=Undibacterium fentianense TaxID=2828728 RepID=A0A941IHN8_9BURK|nr:AzlD domain-containing protein [Undibacterium fentianense]MBR7801165.1 AzlD domain-containing protein [Undibacterium fentianense]